MNLSRLTQSVSVIASTLSFVTLGNTILINSANAVIVNFQNGNFESSIAGSQNSWNTIGDVTTTGLIDGVSPTNDFQQAIITTGYIEDNYLDPIGNRNDDQNSGGDSLVLNQTSQNSGDTNTNPVSADTNSNADDLQESFGYGTDAFSIDRSAGVDPAFGPRTSKEGSGMYQDFAVTIEPGETSFDISFDWSYLTNDGTDALLGQQDFGFWSIAQVVGGNYITDFDSGNDISVLQSGSGSLPLPTGDNDYSQVFDYNFNGRYTYTVDNLTPGDYNYRVGFGVVDVDNLTETSALLIDNVDVSATPVPFEFSPSTGIGLVLGLIGINKLRRRFIQSY